MIFRYKVLINDVNGIAKETECGLVTANSYSEAAENIYQQYLGELESIEKLKMITAAENLVIFPKDFEFIMDKIEEDYVW